LVALVLAGACGCAPSSADFQAKLDELLGVTPGNINPSTLNIRIINEVGSNINIALTLSIDGVEKTFTCTSTQHVCETALATCPGTVDAISERQTDTSGFFQGGTNFNGSDESFNFDSSKFQCGQIIFYRFIGTTVDAFVL
jgi:hypothetical protein